MFWTYSLRIFLSDAPDNSFVSGQTKTVHIDGSGGKFFDVQIDDLDGVGPLELLVTNHQGTKDAIKGSLYYYSLQGGNIRNGTWSRSTVYNNFPVIKSGINQAAPGAAKSFTPLSDDSTSRKYILVSGDGSSMVQLFNALICTNIVYNNLDFFVCFTKGLFIYAEQ